MGERLPLHPCVLITAAQQRILNLMPAQQALDAAIDISGWGEDEEFGIHPYGTKAKRTLICPPDPGNPLLIPGHRYLFKEAESWKGQQMWSEAIAFQIGAALRLPVPPCFVGRDERTGKAGALIEFFYGYPGDERSDRLAHGADVLQGAGLMDGNGQPHFLTVNLRHCEDMGVASSRDWWARVIAFDALIGNTDRHSQNWGYLVTPNRVWRMAPMFDNGTSLAYQTGDAAIDAGLSEPGLNHFIRKGRHSLRWGPGDEIAYDHVGMCGRFVEKHPDLASTMREAIAIKDDELQGFLQACTAIEIAPWFTAGRATMVDWLVRRRRDLMTEMLDQRS